MICGSYGPGGQRVQAGFMVQHGPMDSHCWPRFWAIALILLVAISSSGSLLGEMASDSLGDEQTADTEESRQPLARHADPLDPGLRERLRLAATDELLRIIVQFVDGSAGDAERQMLAEHGFRTLHTTTLVPALFAEGAASSVNGLAAQAGVRWIEWNSPMVLLMNQTNSVIGSEDVWQRTLLDENGVDTGSVISGSGVTVIVLDSGIDASHPDLDYDPFNTPNSPSRPGPDDKVIYNAKLDQGSGSSTPAIAWIPLQNTDTTSGHGTHVAGTVAGNGDASAGDKRGVAPQANLIGLSMGEAAFTIDEYSALEYAYQLSEPGSASQAVWNIRVVTNSWGPGFPFDSLDPNDLTVQAIEKLTYDNNVIVVFANGNSGGDGSDDQSNIFAKVPVAIGVAAAMRDGVGMADFSSRGDATMRDTWPDIAAPGVDIWSAAARATMIGGGTGAGDIASGDLDYHYLAISGTSMATPHVAGLVALLWQAAPSMRMSDFDEDLDSESGEVTLVDPTGIAPPAQAQRTIHEAELILKLTAAYMEEGPNLAGNHSDGIEGRPLDFVQGYGLIDAQRAVAVAVALQQLRDPDRDGVIDAEVTVLDALAIADATIVNGSIRTAAEGLETGWSGDFAVLSSTSQLPPGGHMARSVWLPAGTAVVSATLQYDPLDVSTIWCPQGANLRLVADTDGDGQPDEVGSPSIELVIDGGTEDGAWWTFEVEGNAIGTCLTPNPSTEGPEAHYSVNVRMKLLPGVYELDGEQSRAVNTYGVGAAEVTLERTHFADIRYQEPEPDRSALESVVVWLRTNWWAPTLIAFFIAALFIVSNDRVRDSVRDGMERRRARRVERSAGMDEDEILEADLFDAELIDDLDVDLSASADSGVPTVEPAREPTVEPLPRPSAGDGQTPVTGGLLGRAIALDADDAETDIDDLADDAEGDIVEDEDDTVVDDDSADDSAEGDAVDADDDADTDDDDDGSDALIE